MPVTTLDPRTALVVIDLQKGITGLPLAHPYEGVRDNVVALLDAFRAADLPVVLVNVTGAPAGRTDQGGGAPRVFPDDFAELVPELDQRPSDIVVTKQSRGAFATTDLEATLRGLGVTQVVVTGIATASGVESTAREAHELGFHVTLPVDAMTDSRAAAHDHSIAEVFPRIAETGTTADVLAVLASTRS